MTQTDYINALAKNNIGLDDLRTEREAYELEDKSFTFKGDTLDQKARIDFEITSLRRRMLDFTLENMSLNRIRYFNEKISIVEHLKENEKYDEAKLLLVEISTMLEFTTRFFTTLFKFKKYFDSQNYDFTSDPVYTHNGDYRFDVVYDNPFDEGPQGPGVPPKGRGKK